MVDRIRLYQFIEIRFWVYTLLLQFQMNEFGFMEVVDEEDNKQDKDNNIGDKENVCLSQNSTKVSSTSNTGEKKSKFYNYISFGSMKFH